MCWFYYSILWQLNPFNCEKGVFFFFPPHHGTCGILVSWPGIKPRPLAVKVWSLNHWIDKEFPWKKCIKLFLYNYFHHYQCNLFFCCCVWYIQTYNLCHLHKQCLFHYVLLVFIHFNTFNFYLATPSFKFTFLLFFYAYLYIFILSWWF